MFTVIIPTHQRPILLQRALRSLIAQTWRDFQVIVIDDAATYIPPFAELAELKGRYTYIIRSGELGPSTSRNMAMSLVQTPYTLFLDDDDSLDPNHLQGLAVHLSDSRPPLLFCDFQVQREDRSTNPIQTLGREFISISDVTRDSVFVRNRIPNSCLLYRQDIVAHVRYDTSLPIYEDWDFLLQCLCKNDLQHIPVNSVVIHKGPATAPENMRRGNTRDDLIAPVMLTLYKNRPALNPQTRAARQSLLASAGINVTLEDC